MTIRFQQKSLLFDSLIAMALFGLALWLRATNLAHFVTADEHNWVYRSGLFWNAVLQGDWAGTSVWLTPAVTTTWLGSAGLMLYAQLHQTAIEQPLTTWLVSFSRTRVDLEILLALRGMMALFAALMIVVIYGLARKLWPRSVALLGTLFLLTSPHLLAVSRIIGHDAPATFFITAALLSFLYAKQTIHQLPPPAEQKFWRKVIVGRWFVFSGAMAGLGVLSKAPAMFLIPFVGLVALVDMAQNRRHLTSWIWAMLIWAAAMWLTFIWGWPAAWVGPLQQTWAVINNAFLSSAGLEDADIQPFWSIPDLGIFYYLVHGAFKISPFVMVGLLSAIIAAWHSHSKQGHFLRRLLRSDLFWLLLFAIFFGMFMTLGVKKSPRYILPAFPALAFVAAWGWLKLVPAKWQPVEILVLGGVSLLLAVNYAPYYFSYFNPLLGGAYTAPKLVRIGWGEGLDKVGRWLNSQPNAAAASTGTRYKTGVDPFYQGQLKSPTDEGLDYVIFYIKQSQSGYPTPEILNYFKQQGALQQVKLNGVNYAQIYQGPAMHPIPGNDPTLPVAYRPHTIYAPVGNHLTIDLLWPADNSVLLAENEIVLVIESSDSSMSLEAPAKIITQAPGVNVSTHTFKIPPNVPRDTYNLAVKQPPKLFTPLGKIKARLMDIPPDFEPLDFRAHSLKIKGIKKQQDDNQLIVDLAWQSWPAVINDYTVYIQILDDNGQRITGVDMAPNRGFSTLDQKELMLTHYVIPLPDHLETGEYSLLIGLYYFAGDELINVGSVTLDESIVLE